MPVKRVVKLLPGEPGHPHHGGLQVFRLHGQIAGKPLAGFSHRQEPAAGAQVHAPEIPRHGGPQFLAPGIAGELQPHLIHVEVAIPEGRKVQAGLHGLGVPGQARALQVQVGVDRA